MLQLELLPFHDLIFDMHWCIIRKMGRRLSLLNARKASMCSELFDLGMQGAGSPSATLAWYVPSTVPAQH